MALTKISPEDALRELVESRERLSEIIGAPIRLFCFPYGYYNDELVELARRAGYERVFTTVQRLARPGDFVVGRVRVDPSDWPLEFSPEDNGRVSVASRGSFAQAQDYADWPTVCADALACHSVVGRTALPRSNPEKNLALVGRR